VGTIFVSVIKALEDGAREGLIGVLLLDAGAFNWNRRLSIPLSWSIISYNPAAKVGAVCWRLLELCRESPCETAARLGVSGWPVLWPG
jgi:hypothetical protein